MTRQRYIKLLMGRFGYSRDGAREQAKRLSPGMSYDAMIEGERMVSELMLQIASTTIALIAKNDALEKLRDVLKLQGIIQIGCDYNTLD